MGIAVTSGSKVVFGQPEAANMPSTGALRFIVVFHVVHKFWLKEDAPANIADMISTLDTSQGDKF